MLSQEIIQAAKEVPPTINWRLKTEKFSEDELREIIRNNPRVDWYFISTLQVLSEDFIREFYDKVDWFWVSANQILSEDFIRAFRHYVSWYHIYKYQKLSGDFLREFRRHISWHRLDW